MPLIISSHTSIWVCISVVFNTTQDGSVCLSVSYSAPHEMAGFVSLYQLYLHIRWQCLPLLVTLNIIQEGFASFFNFTIIKTPVSASACHIQHNTRRLCWPLLFSFSIILSSDVSKPGRVGRLRGLIFTCWGCCGKCLDLNQPTLSTPFLFRSRVCFRLYDPFNCISFHTLSRQLSAFSLCSSGLIFASLALSTIIPLYEGLLQPWYYPVWLTGLKTPTNPLSNLISVYTESW